MVQNRPVHLPGDQSRNWRNYGGKRYVFKRDRKVEWDLVLRRERGKEFQTVGAAK